MPEADERWCTATNPRARNAILTRAPAVSRWIGFRGGAPIAGGVQGPIVRALQHPTCRTRLCS